MTKRNRPQAAEIPRIGRRNEEMAKARMMGATLRSIARAFGLSAGRVHCLVGDVLILVRRPRPPQNREQDRNEPRISANCEAWRWTSASVATLTGR